MTLAHHQAPDDLLMGYATGALPRAFDLVMATHVSLCDDTRARLESFDAIGGALLDDMPCADVSADSLEQTMAKLRGQATDERAPVERAVERIAPEGTFPQPLQSAVGGDLDAVRWRSVGGGVKQCVLHSDDRGTARLLLIPAGRAMPTHSHHGTELTLVLKGAFSDDDGTFARGDLELADAQVNHTPVAEPGEDCICLVATDARLKFQGLLPRIAQPFVGI